MMGLHLDWTLKVREGSLKNDLTAGSGQTARSSKATTWTRNPCASDRSWCTRPPICIWSPQGRPGSSVAASRRAQRPTCVTNFVARLGNHNFWGYTLIQTSNNGEIKGLQVSNFVSGNNDAGEPSRVLDYRHAVDLLQPLVDHTRSTDVCEPFRWDKTVHRNIYLYLKKEERELMSIENWQDEKVAPLSELLGF